MIRARLAGLLLLFTLDVAAGQAAPDPKELLKGIKAPPGFEVTLFGAPPEVGYPTCLSAAPDGVLYVGVDENGSLDAKPGRGRVLRCVDADGDGRAEKVGVFATMDSPRGIVWDDGVLYVQHPPFVTAFHDDDRDGKADRSEVLVKGLGFDLKFRGADHTTNGMRLAIDGWLYIAVGDYGFVKATGKDGAELQLHGGGVARVRTDGSGLELYTQGQRNIYDVAVDPFLNAFTRDNTNDGGGWDVRLSHLVPTAHFGYPSLFKNFGEEIVQPLADYGGGSPCGSIFLDEPGLPGGLYTCEWGRSAVFHHPLTPEGAGFRAGQKSFVEIQRPTDMDVDGRSQVYIASWKNGGFNYSGPNVGFVARVAPAAANASAFPDLRKAAEEQLVRTLSSPSHVARLAAQREILRRGNRTIPIDVAPGDPLAGRVAALFTLAQLRGELAFDRLGQLASDKDLAEFALRALADRKSGRVPTGLFVQALGDPNPRVRLQAAVGLGRLGRKEAAPDLVKLLADPDPLVAHVVANALVSLRASEACLAALDAGNLRACRVLQALHETAVVDGLLERLVRSQDPAPILKALCRLYTKEAAWDGKWWGTRPDTTGPYYSPVKWEGSERIGKALSSALGGAKPEALRPLLVELQKCRVDLPEAEPLVLKLAARDPSFRPVAVEMLARRNPLPAEAVELFAGVAVSEKEPVALRARAVRALVRSGAAPDAVVRALAKPEGDLQPVWEEFVRDARHAQNVERFAALALSERSEVAFGVLARLANARGTPKEAKAAASRAVERAWSQADLLVPLLRAVGRARESGYAFQVITFAKDARPDVKKAAAYAADQLGLNKVSQGTPIGKLPYEQVLTEAAKEKGDPKHGAALYARQGCGACHTVSADEAPKGPFLGGIATRYSRAELIESILKPSAKIAQGFETQGFKLANDDVIEGFVARESGDEVEVRTVQGTATVIPKKGLQARVRRELSVMPTGLADTLTPGDLSSLLAYLESLKSK